VNNQASSEEFNRAEQSRDVVCLSHLRWDFVYQRPQHLLSRFAKEGRVFFFEEPIFTDEATHLEITPRTDNLFVAVPRINHSDGARSAEIQRAIAQRFSFGTRNKKLYFVVLYTVGNELCSSFAAENNDFRLYGRTFGV